MLLSLAFRRGLIGGSRFWTVLGIVGIGVRVLKKLTGNEPEVVYRTELSPGQSVLVSHDREARVVRGGP